MLITAVADIHSPRFMDEFVRSLRSHKAPDLFLIAGDMIDRGTSSEFPKVLDAIQYHLGGGFPIIACFGNEEYTEVRPQIIDLVGNRMTFLDERAVIINANGLIVGVVGTQGSLDRPTEWQKMHLPNVRHLFRRRADRASYLLRRLAPFVDRRILLMHYSPCRDTCKGEDERYFAWLFSKKFHDVVVKERPDLVIHGHVHNSIVHEAKIGQSIVRNVAFPATKCLTKIEIE